MPRTIPRGPPPAATAPRPQSCDRQHHSGGPRFLDHRIATAAARRVAVGHGTCARRHRSGRRDHVRALRPQRPDLLDGARVHHSGRGERQRRLPLRGVRRGAPRDLSLGGHVLRRRHEHRRWADRLRRPAETESVSASPGLSPEPGRNVPKPPKPSPQAQASPTATAADRHRITAAGSRTRPSTVTVTLAACAWR